MEYVLDTSRRNNLNWNATGNERIIQNVNNIINTWKYEVAFNREMGILSEVIDNPKDSAAALYISEIYRVVAEFEPRAKVKEVEFIDSDQNGNMQFKVVINI
jgi:Gene 25-like lysozyme.